MDSTESNSADIVAIHDECFKPSTLGQVSSKAAQEFIFVLYIATASISFVSNIAVILVQVFGSASSRSIRKYLNNLAVSDILLSVMSMPFTYTNLVLGNWVFPLWLCPTSQYVQVLSAFVTSATLTIIGIERYVVTLHPLSRVCEWFQSHNGSILLGGWVVGVLYSSIPPLSVTTEFNFPENSTTDFYWQCSANRTLTSTPLYRVFIVGHFVISFIVPFCAILISYTAIMNKLKFNNSFIAQYFSTSSSSSGSRRAWICVKAVSQDEPPNAAVVWPSVSVDHRSKSIKMMFIVVLAYIISWAPVKIFAFLRYHNILIPQCATTESAFNLQIYVYIFCHWLAMANSFVNPIIYSFLSKNFRDDFRKIAKTFWEHITSKRRQS